MENLKALFVEVVKAELSKTAYVSKTILEQVIYHYSQYTPFNKISIEQWYCICSINGIKYDI